MPSPALTPRECDYCLRRVVSEVKKGSKKRWVATCSHRHALLSDDENTLAIAENCSDWLYDLRPFSDSGRPSLLLVMLLRQMHKASALPGTMLGGAKTMMLAMARGVQSVDESAWAEQIGDLEGMSLFRRFSVSFSDWHSPVEGV